MTKTIVSWLIGGLIAIVWLIGVYTETGIWTALLLGSLYAGFLAYEARLKQIEVQIRFTETEVNKCSMRINNIDFYLSELKIRNPKLFESLPYEEISEDLDALKSDLENANYQYKTRNEYLSSLNK